MFDDTEILQYKSYYKNRNEAGTKKMFVGTRKMAGQKGINGEEK